MLSVTLIYLLMILLSTVGVIKHLVCDKNWSWLKYDLQDTGKTLFISFDQSNNSGAIDVKMDRPFLEEKPYY